MSLLDAMDMGLSGMNAGAALIGNAGISLGDMFSQNLQAARANLLHQQRGGNQSAAQIGSTTQGTSAGIEGAIGHSLCEADPADALAKMMMGREMYGANGQMAKATNQMVGTLLDTVNEP